ncbi:MAG: DUF2974 domain-containing protein [Firmicutes bacterium]|nr:DUF2974 domain-containing protein [Bacillota bacterium]
MALSEREMLLLDCFMYSDLAPYNSGHPLGDVIDDYMVNGKVSVEKLQRAVDNGTIHLSGDLGPKPNKPEDLADIMQKIYDDPKLRRQEIRETTPEYKGSIRAAAFYDPEDGDVTVAFRGTGGSYQQWSNNFEGFGDESQQTQRDAEAFINSLPYDYVDVTGHSNGGDQAMYVTIVCGEKVHRCVSFEGQGVSKEFMNEYADEIDIYRHKIKNICGEKDFVSTLLVNIAGETIYVGSDSSLLGGLFSHGSYGLLTYAEEHDSFDADGNYLPSAAGEQAWYCKALHGITVILAGFSDVPFVGPTLELIADVLGFIVGAFISEGWDMLRIWDPEILEAWGRIFADLGKSLMEYLEGQWESIKQVYEQAKLAITHIVNGIKQWCKENFDKGYKYATSHPFIVVDTYRLRNYAQRIQNVQNRLYNVDGRLDRLYKNVGITEAWNIQKADMSIGYSSRLKQCVNYLYATAEDFEEAERELSTVF